MKITNGAFVRKSLAVFSAAISLIAFISCGEDTGLGSTIDTEAPKIAISYPNPKVSNVARDEFVLAGTCSDDKLISRVQVAVTNLDTQTSYGTFPATLDAKSNTWSVKLNTFDASNEDNCNGYPFPDGNYKFVATAYDNAGHSTQDTSSFEIDNTAPVVILKSPGSVTTATEYGSSFYVEGTIAEEHTVSSLKVTIYDEAGNVLDQTDVTPYIESDIATSGGTNVSFMKFSTGSSTLRERYKNIYGENKDGVTRAYTCAIYVSDNAKEFKNPGESSNTSGGNETPVFYLYSDVYKSLMSSNGYGLSASDLMRIINGTYTASDDSSRSASGGEGLTSEQLAEVKAILAREGQSGYDAEKSKATDTSEKHLKFSLNPKVNPTYTISGLSIDSSAGSYPSGNKGQTLTFILSPGLDGTLIEAATVKAWLLKCRSQEEGLSEEDYDEFLSDPAKFEGATKILDLSEKYDSDTMLSSLTSTFKLPEITANYFYIVAISGVDADGNELVPDGTFGFIGALSGTPPKVTIETPAKQAIIGSSADITFSGSVVTTDVELESIDISFDVTNLADGTSLTTSESTIKLIASGSGKEGDAVTWAEPEYNSATSKYTYTWTCNLRDCDNYELFSAEKGSGKIYSYTATVKATDISGNYSEGSSMVTADTLPPVITVSSLLPSVSDYTDENHTDENVVYVNGNITISGTIYDDNLKTAYYTVLVNGKTVKNEAGNDDEEFTKVTIPNTQFKINVDTTKLEDDSKFDILIYAEDRANASSSSTITTVLSDEEGTGNNTSVNVSETDLYDDGVSLRILQETDRPVISTTNADSSITDYDGIIAAVKAASALSTNIFSMGGKLNATVSDDDGIDSVIVEYSSDGSDYKELSSKYSASNNTLSAELPPSGYGEYHIRITAKDKKGLEFGSAVSEFYIAVDDGIPTFSGVQPTDGNYYNDVFTVSGSVKDASGQVSLRLKDELNGILANAEGASGTSASVSGNSGVKTGAKFEDTVKVPSESGAYTLTYIASDKYLQESEYSISYTVDKDKPILSDFAGFENGGNLGTKAPPISVKASDDLSGLAKVSVYDGNGTEIAQLSGLGSLYQGNVSLSEGKNSICVKAFDKAGNEARLPESGFFTVTVDTVAPAIESPSLSDSEINAEEYGSADFDGVTVTATVTDVGSGAKYAWLSTDGGETSYSGSASAIKAENKNEDLTAEWNVSLLIPKAAFSDDSGARDGQYTYYLYAEDAAPNAENAAKKTSVSSALTFVVDTTAPKFTVSVLKDGKKSFTQNDVSDLDESKTRAKYSLSGSWKDLQTGTASLQYATSATPAEDDWEEISNTAAANIALSWNATIDVRESQGNSLSFRARDKAGNVSAVTTYSGLIFDFSAPSITLNSTIPSQTREPVTVAGSVSDSLAVSKEKIIVKAVKGSSELSADVSEVTEKEGKEYSYSLEIPATEENNGSWTISFEATDEAGQKTTLPSKTVTLDTSVPTLSYDWSTSPATASGSSFDSGNKTVYFNGSKTLTVNITVKDNDGGVGLSVVEYNILSDRKTEWAEDGALNSSWSSLSKVGSSDVWKATIISDFAALSDGDYTVFIRSSDELGNEAYAEPLYLVSDKTSPVLSETVASGKAISSAGLSYEAGNFSLSGIITDANLASLEYTLDGRVPQVLATVGDAWSIENDSVADEGGSFAYVLTATDKAGNTAKLIRTVIIDKTAPELSLDAWKNSDGDEINNKNSGTVTFSGSVSDESDGSGLDSVKVWYTSNSEKVEASVSPDSDGKWTYTFTNVAEGSYTIYALAKDKAGNEKQVYRDFGVDLTKPAVSGQVSVKNGGSEAAKGSDGNYIVKENFTLSGIVSDKAFRAKNVRLTVKKDGGAESTVISSTDTEEVSSLDWTYTQTLPADSSDHTADGLYTYKLTATDDAGNSSESSFIVRVDTSAPTINISSPTSGANFKPASGTTTTINLSGTAFDDGAGVSSVSYVIKKGDTVVTSDTATVSSGKWNATVNIKLGEQGELTLEVEAKDYLDNSDSSEVSFYCDSIAPVLSAVSVKTSKDDAYDYYSTRLITITASASDAVSGVRNLTYSLNGGSAKTMTLESAESTTAAGKIAVYTAEVTCEEEANTIIISASDANGNTTSDSETATLTFNVDATAPVFSDTSVSNSASSTDVVVSGKLTENIALSSVNGLEVSATKDGMTVSKEDLLLAITAQPEYSSEGALANSPWTFTLKADSETHSNDGKWVFTVTAKDIAGNTSNTQASVLIDTTSPVVGESSVSTTGSSSASDVTYFNSTYPLSITTSVADSVGTIAEVEYAAYSGNLSEPSAQAVIEWAQLSLISGSYKGTASGFINANDGKGIDDGAYTIFIRATDSVGNVSALKAIHLVADKTAPAFSVASDTGKSIITTEGIGTYFEKGSFTIDGSLTESNLESLTYTLNGGEAQVLDSSSGWSISSGTIPEEGGTFAYIITAKDKAGSVATVKRTITIDKIAPEVSVDAWKDSTNTFIVTNKNSSTVTFSGNVSDENVGSGLASLELYYSTDSETSTKTTVNPDSTGNWTYTFTGVEAGDYTLHVVATDNAGNETSKTKEFGVDLTKPASTLNVTNTIYDNSINSPVALVPETDYASKWNDNVTYIAKENFTLSGIVSDKAFRAKNVRLTVKKDGGSEETVVSSTNTDKTLSSLNWSYEKSVLTDDHSADGVYTYKLTATDDAGNSADYSFIVRVDTTAPTINISSPASGANFKYTTGTTITDINISGTAFDSGAGAYKVYYDITQKGTSVIKENPSSADKEADFDDGTTWGTDEGISIPNNVQGNLTLHIKAIDYLGNESEKTVDFVCDSIAPVIKEDSITLSETPSNGYYKNASQTISVYVKDEVSGISSVSAVVDTDSENIVPLNPTTTVDDDGYTLYTGRISFGAEGKNTISITATDKVNNSKTTENALSVQYDANAPVITITEKPSESITNSAVTIKGTVSDSIKLSSDGITVYAANGKYTGTALAAKISEAEATVGKAYSFEITVPASALTDGLWTVNVNANDVSGRSAVAQSASFTIDTTLPELSSPTATADKSSVLDSKTYFNSTKPLTISVSASDASKNGYAGTVSEVDYAVYKGNISEIPESTENRVIAWAPLTPKNNAYTVSATGMIDAADGDYTVFLRATDAAGNKSELSTIHLVADKTAPAFTVTSDTGKSITTTGGVGKYFETGSENGFTISGTLTETNFDSLTYTLKLNDSDESDKTTLPLTTNGWSISSRDTTEGGTFAYIITATDKAGNEASVKRTVTIDKIAPTIEVDDWKDSTGDVIDKTSSKTVTFSGKLKDYENGSGIASAKIYYVKQDDSYAVVDEGDLSIDNNGEWKYSFYNVEEGKYTLHITSEDNAGNEAKLNNGEGKNFGVDCAAPTSTLKVSATVFDKTSGTPVALSDTEDHSGKWNKGTTFIANKQFTLSGTVSDTFTFRASNIKFTVTKQGGSTTDLTSSVISSTETGLSSLDWTYTSEETSALVDGVYTYKLTTADDAGNAATYSFIVQVDTSAPTLTIVKPASGANFKPASGSTEIAIEGTAFDDGAGAYQVKYNVKKGDTVVKDETLATLTSGKWNDGFELSDSIQGNLVLTVTVTDYLGNSDVSTVSFFCDSKAPILSNDRLTTNPKSGFTYYDTTVLTITADATDVVSGVGNLTYTLNNGTAKTMSLSSGSSDAGKSGTYTASVVFTEGENTIYVTATDTNGNFISSTPIVVKVDTKAPEFGSSIAVTKEADDKKVSVASTGSNADVTVSGTISEGYGMASTNALVVTATKNGEAVSDLSTVISDLTSLNQSTVSALTDSVWSFKVLAASDHSNDGKWVFTITATDVAGNTSTTTANVLIDTTAPSWFSSENSDYKFKVGGQVFSTDINNPNWYKDSSLSVIGYLTESANGSGVKTVTYTLKDSNNNVIGNENTSIDTNKSTGTESSPIKFQSEIDGFVDNAQLSFTIEDEAGNKTSYGPVTVRVDGTDPEAYAYDVDFTSVDKTNGKTNKTISFLVKEADSGLNESSITVNVGSTYKGLKAGDTGIAISVTAVSSSDSVISDSTKPAYSQKTDIETYSASYKLVTVTLTAANYLSGLNGTLGITASLKDVAGNSWSGTIATIELDTIAPTVKISSVSPRVTSGSTVKVNKTFTITGTAEDSNTVNGIRLYASGNNITKTLWYVGTSSITYGSTEISSSDSANTVTYDSSTKTWSAEIDSTYFYDSTGTASLLFEVIAMDNAGNWTGDNYATDTSKYASDVPATSTYTIDQNTDRPLIKLTNITQLTSGSDVNYVLKNISDAHLEGSVTDDDNDSASIIKQLYVIAAEDSADVTWTWDSANKKMTGWTLDTSDTSLFKATHATYGTVELTLSSGDWTYTPATALQKDGSRKLYFYAVDNVGTPFQTAATGTLSQPYWQYKTFESTKADASSSLAYRIDGTSPDVKDFTATSYASDSDDAEATFADESVGYTFVAGGEGTTKRYVVFKITATDSNGIAGMRMTLTQGSTSVSFASGATVQTSANETVSGSCVPDSLDSTKSVWTTGKIDMNKFATGEVTVSVVPVDNCSLTGSDRKTFNVDKTGPTISVTSPSAGAEQIGSVTISGTATDNTGGAGTSKVYFAIPKTGVSEATTVYSDDWGGNLSSISASVWSFLLDGTSSNNPSLVTYLVRTSDDDAQIYNVLKKTGTVTNATDIWELPVFFKAVDAIGNVSYGSHTITYNPNADMAVTTISYPTEGDYSDYIEKDNDGNTTLSTKLAIIGGTIRVNGAVSFDDSSAEVGAVFLQLGSVAYTNSNPAITWSESLAVADGHSELYNVAGTGSTAGATYKTVTSLLSGVTTIVNADSSWWGIKATNKSYSWNISLNENEKLNDTKFIAIRSCTVNSKGKVGNWSDPVYINIDSSAPQMSATLKQFKTAPTSNWSTAAADSEKAYSAGMYLRNPNGNWYVEVKITDDDGINEAKTTVNGADKTQEISSDSKTSYIYFPVSKYSGTASYSLYVEDKATPAHSSSMSFTIYVDNDAPVMGELKETTEGSSFAYNKIRNSNFNVSMTANASDSGAGFAKLAYFFKRTVDGTTTIELPLTVETETSGVWQKGTAASMTLSSDVISLGTSGSAGNSVSLSEDATAATGASAAEDTSGLYGVTLTGGTRGSTTTFEHALVSDYAEKGVIRVGSIARIGGAYNKITKVDTDTVTFENPVAETHKDAFFALAFVVDNNGESSKWEVGKNTLSEDDGDGIYEKLLTSSWTSEFCSDGLDDGPVSIVCAAFDSVENAASQETKVMITNNTPRLTKVFLATDLNGDGSFAQNEFAHGSVYLNDSEATGSDAAKSYISALSASKESATAIVKVGEVGDWTDSGSITSTDTVGTTLTKLFRVSDASVVTFEFVSGVEGYGSGNVDITPYMSVGDTALSAPDSTVAHRLSNIRELSSDTVKYPTAQTKKGVALEASLFSGTTTDGKVKTTYGDYTESTSSADTRQFLSFTLWDNTKGTTVGVADSNIGESTVVFGSQYTVVNIPVYFDFVDDKAPVVTVDTIEAASDESGNVLGHVELSDTLPSDYFTVTGNGKGSELDQDPKLSGVVLIKGSIADNKRINAATLKMAGGTNGEYIYMADSAQTVASFDSGTLGVNTVTSAAWTVTLSNEKFTQDKGHTVDFEIYLPTTATALANNTDHWWTALDLKIELTASDNNSHSTANDDLYVDVVPYITGITRSATTNSVISTTYRSTYGEYPVAIGDTLTVTGFNLGGGKTNQRAKPTVKVGGTTVTATMNTDNEEFKFPVPANSGELIVTVNGVYSLNHLNNNANANNQETVTGTVKKSSTLDGNVLYDNRYLRVWDVGHYFSASKNGNKPTLAADKTGNLFSSWTIMGSSQVQMQKGISGTNKAVWVSYDQPDQESYISIDKNSTAGDLALIFSTAHVGSSGKGTSNGYADLNRIGGMMGTGIPNNFSSINVSTNDKGVLDIKIAGNPYSTMDQTHAPGFQLASYAMIRDVSKYTTGHSARYETNMHFVYYDAKNKALRYTYQPTVTNAQNTTDEYSYSISGWTVIDGNTDGQDRVHNGDTYGLGVSSYSAENKTVTFSTTVSANAGDTLGLAYESSSGLHKFDLFTVSASVTNKKTVSFTGDFTDTVSGKPTGGAIYRGETNYLTKTKNGLDNVKTVGPYNAIDVTKTGKPVIVYFDADNETLRIAYTSSVTPSMTDTATGRDKWTRQSLAGIVSGGTYVQAKIDGNNYLHILYRDNEGALKYLRSSNNPDGETYTFDKNNIMSVDTAGTYGTLSLIRSGEGTTASPYSYTPCVSWLNSEGTANGVKYAVLRTVDQGTQTVNGTTSLKTTSLWDTQIVPAVSGNYVTGGEYIYTEGFNGWTANTAAMTDSVDTSKCDAIIGYNTGRMDVLFLKSEQ